MERLLILIAAVAILVLILVFGTTPREPEQMPELPAAVLDDPWFREHVLENPRLTVVDFTAPWCTFCRRMDPLLARLENDYPDRIEVVKVDVDEHPDLAKEFGAPPIPLILVMLRGEVVGGARGAVGYEVLESLVEPHLHAVSGEIAPEPTLETE